MSYLITLKFKDCKHTNVMNVFKRIFVNVNQNYFKICNICETCYYEMDNKCK